MRKDFFYKVNKHIQYKLLDCIVKNKNIKNEIFLEKEYIADDDSGDNAG